MGFENDVADFIQVTFTDRSYRDAAKLSSFEKV